MTTRCKHPRCPGHAEKATGYCVTHSSEYVQRRPFDGAAKTTMASAYYATTEWRKFTRGYVKAHPVCALCGKPSECTDHHLMSAPEMIRQFGGFIYDERYYRALCTSCNTKERNRKMRRGNT